ncbi:MAG: ATP-binding protein, partial [Chloroflexota bacterium]
GLVEGKGSGALVPLVSRGELVGALLVGGKRSGLGYAEGDVRFLDTIASNVAIAIDNARLYQEAKGSYLSLRQAQQAMIQSERLRALGEAAAGVAHDFSNALTTILTRAQLAQEDSKDQRVKHALSQIEQAALDATNMVRRLRMVSQQPKTERATAVALDEAVKSVMALVEPRLRELQQTGRAPIEIVFRLESGAWVEASAADLREVATNIILNALDAMPAGGRLEVSSHIQDGWVEVRFADSGVGISPEIQPRIFEPFFTTKAGTGTGLGLPICQRLVSELGGTITVSSVPSKGSTFVVRLPVCTGTMAPQSEGTPGAAAKKGTVLLIDDDPDTLQSLREIVVRLGYAAHTASDGAEALRLLEQRGYDAVLADFGMGKISGFEVAEQLRKMHPGTPLALVTGWNLPLSRAELDELEIQMIVPKPFQVQEIAEVLEMMWQNSGAGQNASKKPTK